MRLSAPFFKLKRQAKLLAREHDIPLHKALDRVAVSDGFRSWSHLASSSSKARPTEQILAQLNSGDMLLLGARPGHGKTLLGLELAVAASQAGWKGFFFTLDYNENDIQKRLQALSIDSKKTAKSFFIDTSDDICANHIIDRLGEISGKALVVLDYLQLLDQKRTNPDLGTQILTLKSFAQSSGSIIVAISQIDRSFDLNGKQLPELSDVRLPNPFDLSFFNKTCFLHDGELKFELVT